MDTMIFSTLWAARPQNALHFYRASLAAPPDVTAASGDIALEIQNGLQNQQTPEMVTVSLWINHHFIDEQTLGYRNMFTVWVGGKAMKPMCRKRERENVRIVATWNGRQYGPFKFHAVSNPEHVHLVVKNHRLRFLYRGDLH